MSFCWRYHRCLMCASPFGLASILCALRDVNAVRHLSIWEHMQPAVTQPDMLSAIDFPSLCFTSHGLVAFVRLPSREFVSILSNCSRHADVSRSCLALLANFGRYASYTAHRSGASGSSQSPTCGNFFPLDMVGSMFWSSLSPGQCCGHSGASSAGFGNAPVAVGATSPHGLGLGRFPRTSLCLGLVLCLCLSLQVHRTCPLCRGCPVVSLHVEACSRYRHAIDEMMVSGKGLGSHIVGRNLDFGFGRHAPALCLCHCGYIGLFLRVCCLFLPT